jgi:hypothetical protein
MTNQEAKFILRGYRSDRSDTESSLFAEALRQARSDPALGDWLAREQAHDAVVASKLREITPPAGLRAAILAGGRASKPARESKHAAWWVLVAAAAAVLLVTSIGLWPKTAGVDRLSEFALADTAEDRHEGAGDAVRAVQTVLSDSRMRLREQLKVDLADLKANGCRTVSLDGSDVLEICFRRDGTTFHLYAMRDAESGADTEEVVYRERGDLSCATWSDRSSGVRYAVVTSGGLQSVRNLL